MPNFAPTVGFNPLPEAALPGKPAYFYGGNPVLTQDTQMLVTNVAITSNVATVNVTVIGGNIPAVGNLITIQGVANNSGLFNVKAAAITGVTITASTGKGTITFALTNANVASAAAAGMAYVPIAETSETLANGGSVAIYVPAQEPRDLGQKSITVATTFPSLPTAATVTLYTAINLPQVAPGTTGSEWTSMGVVATVAGGSQTAGPLVTFATPAGRFFGVAITGVSGGTSPTVICKMLC